MFNWFRNLYLQMCDNRENRIEEQCARLEAKWEKERNNVKHPVYAEQTTSTDDMMLGAMPEIKMIPMPTESVKKAIYTIGVNDAFFCLIFRPLEQRD